MRDMSSHCLPTKNNTDKQKKQWQNGSTDRWMDRQTDREMETETESRIDLYTLLYLLKQYPYN